MSLVKRVEISPREFNIRKHQFQLQRRIEKQTVKERYKGKGLSADEVYWLVLKSIISQRLVGFTRLQKETKNHAACVLVIWCLTRVFNSKIIEDEVIYNFWRFLVKDFFLPVIKPPETYFNNKLLPQLQIFEVPVRLDRNSKSVWRQSVLIFLRQTLHWKL